MTIIARLQSWTKAALRRSRMENEMDTELQFHLESYAEDLVRAGMMPEEALRRARLEFGGIESRKEECRASLGLRLWDECRADLRYASRMLRQSPAFTAVAIISLALGIGANTAIFSMTEEVLLKALPVGHPEELRLLSWIAGPKPMVHDIWGNYEPTSSGGHTSTVFSYPVYLRLRSQNKVFQDLFAFKDISRLTATIDGNAEPVAGQLVSGGFYRDLGVQPVAGRAIQPSDDNPSSAPVAVISDAFWKGRFGRSVGVIGKTIALNGTAVTIVGVNPPQFRGTNQGSSPEVFLPISLQPQIVPNSFVSTPDGSLLANKEEFWVLVMGRLKPGVKEARAQAALDVAFSQALKETLPANLKDDMPHLKLLTGDRGMDGIREHFSKPIYVLMSMAAVVLLLACVNLANLLLARATAREREIGIRAALGAGRGRIIRQVFTESMLLAVLGGGAGILLGYLGRNLIPSLTHSAWEPSGIEGQFDLRVLGFAIALCVFTGLLFGLAPAWHATREDLNAGLKETGRMSVSRPKVLAGKLLVSFQVSLSVLLVIGAGLFVRTLINLRSTSIGFEPQHILLFSLDPPRSRYPAAQRIPFFHEVEEKVAAIPGVSDVALSSYALLSNSTSITDFTPDMVAGRPSRQGSAWLSSVGASFFRTMGIPLLYGREFNSRDTAKSPSVAIINERLAKQFFPGVNPIGQTFNKKHVQIVGVCANAKIADLRTDPPAMFYTPYLQDNDASFMTYEVKTAASTASVAAAIRQVLRSIDRDIPLTDVRTQTEQIDATLNQDRLFAMLTSSFGLIALLLASIGIYGIMAYTVARRTNEIGIRMALGAQSVQVLVSVLREAIWLTCAGLAVGVTIALALTRLVSNMLFGLKPSDPSTVIFAILLLFSVALMAGLVPARRASRVDPMSALRHD
jgi:predicted permease